MTLIKDPAAPATPAQTSYLADLIKNRDLPVVEQRYNLVTSIGVLTKGQASQWIDQLVKAPKKATATTKTFTPAADPQYGPAAVVAQALTALPAFGYYEIDGTIYHWDVTGKDAKPTLRKLSIVTNWDGSKKGKWAKTYGSTSAKPVQKVQGTYLPYGGKGYNKSEVTTTVWVPGILASAAVEGAFPLTQDQVAAKGKAYTFCVRCGATLTDPVSVANGIGPVCAKYWA